MPGQIGLLDTSVRVAPFWGGQGISAAQSAYVANVGRGLVAQYGADYARLRAPRSPNPFLAGNVMPGYSGLSWLAGQNKCNQFVGDVLYLSGLKVPLASMRNGSYHYLNAEGFIRNRDVFTPVTDLSSLRPGDILALDYPKSGSNGAHLEIVTSIDLAARSLVTVGAHQDGASETSWSLLRGLPTATSNEYWQLPGKRLYFLRPQ